MTASDDGSDFGGLTLSGVWSMPSPYCQTVLDLTTGGRSAASGGAVVNAREGDPVTVSYTKVKKSTCIPDLDPLDSRTTAIAESAQGEAGYYIVETGLSGWVLATRDYNTGPLQVAQLTDKVPEEQQWILLATEEAGCVRLKNPSGGLIAYAQPIEGVEVVLGGSSEDPTGRWRLVPGGDNQYWLRHEMSGFVAAVPSSSPKPEDSIVLARLDRAMPATQIFSFAPVNRQQAAPQRPA